MFLAVAVRQVYLRSKSAGTIWGEGAKEAMCASNGTYRMRVCRGVAR